MYTASRIRGIFVPHSIVSKQRRKNLTRGSKSNEKEIKEFYYTWNRRKHFMYSG